MTLSTSAIRLLLVALPLAAVGIILVLWFPSVAIANNIGDQWANVGLFFNYPQALHSFPDIRYVSRVPVVLSGYILTSVLGTGLLTASYILFFGYYLATLLFFYFASSRLMSKTVAFFSTIFLATNALIIGNFSTTLADVPATVYTVASLYFVALAITAKKQALANSAMLASGLAFGLAINCHLVILASAGANYLIYIVYELQRTADPLRKRISRVAIGAVLALLGAALATAMLGAIIVLAFHGSFWQILNDFLYVPRVLSTTIEYFMPDWPLHVVASGMLLGICLVALLNIAVVLRRRNTIDDDVPRRLVAVSVAGLALSVILVAYEELNGGIFLQFSSYYFCFVPYFALVVFSPFLTAARRSIGLMWSAPAFYVCSVIVVLLREQLTPWLYHAPAQAEAAVACALLLAILYASFVVLTRSVMNAREAASYCLAVLAMAFIMRPDEQVGSNIWIYPYQHTALQRGLYIRIGEGLRFLNSLNLEPYPKFWVDLRDPKFLVDIGASDEPAILSRAYLQYRYQPFPNIDRTLWNRLSFCRFDSGDNVVIVSEAPAVEEEAAHAFRTLHLTAEEIATHLVAYNGVRYRILVERVSQRVDERR